MKDPQDDEDERANDAPLVAEAQSFGTWLRRQREVREIDLREIADSTKVSMSYLRAFEEDRFDVLPASVFAKGFLRQYARYVGLEPEEVVNFYLAARQPQEDEASLVSTAEPEPPARNYLFFVLAVTAALVLLVWLLSVYGDRTDSGRPAPAPPAPVPAAGVAVEPPAAMPAEAESEAASSAEESRPPAEPDAAPPVEEPRPPLRVTLDFLSDCWVEASVDGAKTVSELKVQGESLLLDAEEIVEFKVGDVAAVQVEVNGLPYEIESRKGTSVRTVSIDLEAAAAVAAAAADSSAPQAAGSPTDAVEP